MKTITLQIGNSDDKLSQKKWAEFVEDVDDLIQRWAYRIHFSGSSHPFEIWQNACWVFMAANETLEKLKPELIGIKNKYKQDSVAWTEGKTEFLE